MKQLTKNLKNGKLKLIEVPLPLVENGKILVKNHFSAISAGTEGRTIRDARLSYLQKAKARPKEFKQVIETAKKKGIMQTYSMVMNKLTSPSRLGYSCAGEVIDVGEGVDRFKIGDYVACGGQGANHAEIVSVSENLCVKVPGEVNLKYASFTTIGSIAIHGIRQADLRFGEYCVVIGLGLVGQITLQILRAAGIKSIGIDIDKEKVELAKKNNADIAFVRETEGIEEKIRNFTNGFGADAVIITAATTSNDPINLAGELSRKKAKVVSVGRVSTSFNRDTYYNKELDLRMSCSYGPGRYDVEYEEKGHDYPIGYVRWTENRNMQAFIDLLASKKINLNTIITHEFDFVNADKAYNIISEKSEPYLGIILKYATKKLDLQKTIILDKRINKYDEINIGFIGAGSFAQKFLLPNVAGKANLISVATRTSINAKHIASKYKFQKATCDSLDLIRDDKINTVFIATRNNTHASFVIESLKNNKNVFVEKPLCLFEEELIEIKKEYEKRKLHLMVGFNRRFAPQVKLILDSLGKNSIKTINYRVNLGPISPEHWTQDKEVGGGRIKEEVCHFIDLAMFLCNSKPEMLSAFNVEDPLHLFNTLSLIIRFKNGSVATISYYANGNASLNKEYLEVHSNNISAVLDDFNSLSIYGEKKLKNKTKIDKGHKEEVNSFLKAIKNGGPTPISFEDIYWTTKMTFDVLKSIKSREIIKYL